MRIGVVGVGKAGGALTEALLADHDARQVDYVPDYVVVDTDADDLRALDRVPEERRHLVGAVQTDGEGTAGDANLAADIAQEDRPELLAAVDSIPVGSIDATVVATALGGGTGAGVAPELVEILAETTATPVYTVGVLPGEAETGGDGGAVGVGDGPKRPHEHDQRESEGGPDRPLTANAVRAIRALSRLSDDLLLADVDVWRSSGSPYAPAWSRMDDDLAARLGSLFAAGETTTPTPERVLDVSELTNTFGAGGVSVIGSASTSVSNGRREGVVGGLLDRVAGRTDPEVDEGEAVSVATNSARKAVAHQLSMPCDPRSASRAAVVFHAPPAWLSRRGLERARALVEEETAVPQIRWGDYPDPDAESFRVTVLLTGVDDADRLAEMRPDDGSID